MNEELKRKLSILRSRVPGIEGDPELIKAWVWHRDGQYQAVMNMRGEVDLFRRAASGEWENAGLAEFEGPRFKSVQSTIPDGVLTELADTIWAAVRRKRQRTKNAWERFAERK